MIKKVFKYLISLECLGIYVVFGEYTPKMIKKIAEDFI